MEWHDELRKIAKDILKKIGGNLNDQQYWALRLRIIADEIEKEQKDGKVN